MNFASSHTPIINSSGIVFREDFQDPVSIRKNGGVITGTIPIKGGWAEFDKTAGQHILYSSIKTQAFTKISVGIWFKDFTDTATTMALFSNWGQDEEKQCLLYSSGGSLHVFFRVSNSGRTTSAAWSGLNILSKNFLVGTWATGDYVRLYLNGQQVAISAGTYTGEVNTISAHGYSIGNGNANNYNWPALGKLNGAFISNRQLSATEISDLYKHRTYR